MTAEKVIRLWEPTGSDEFEQFLQRYCLSPDKIAVAVVEVCDPTTGNIHRMQVVANLNRVLPEGHFTVWPSLKPGTPKT